MIEAMPFWFEFALDLFACESILDCGRFALAFVAKSTGLRAKNFTKFRLCIVFPLLLNLLGYQIALRKSKNSFKIFVLLSQIMQKYNVTLLQSRLKAEK